LTVEFGLLVENIFFPATKINTMSQRPRDIGRIIEVAVKRGLKLRQKRGKAEIEKSALD